VFGSGSALAPQVQITCGGTRVVDAELVSFDILFSVGGSVV
jgi:hypothetical protein